MFIRIKKIKGQPYAYLVESVWTKHGSRQKTKAYLGKVVPLGEAPHQSTPEGDGLWDACVTMLSNLLENRGFIKDPKTPLTYQKDDVVVDLAKHETRAATRPCALQVNQGFVCDHTLARLKELDNPHIVAKLADNGNHIGQTLADALVSAGLLVEKEHFLDLYTKIVPNALEN